MVLLRCLLLCLIASLACAQETVVEPEPPTTEETESGTHPVEVGPANVANPIVQDPGLDGMQAEGSKPEPQTENSPGKNLTVNVATTAASTTAASDTTTEAPSAATELGVMSATVLCFISALVLS